MTWTRREFMTTSALAAASCAVLGCASSSKEVKMPETPVQAPVVPVATIQKDYFYHHFGITREMIDQVLGKALSKGGHWGDLFFEHSRKGGIVLLDGKVSQGQASTSLGMGVRCVYEDQVGYGYTESLAIEDMMRAAEAAAAIAPNVDVGSIQRRKFQKYDTFYAQDINWDLLELSKAVALLQDIEKRTRAKDASIIQVSLSLQWHQRNVMINTSDGMNAEDSAPRYMLSMNVVMKRGDVVQSNRAALAGTHDFASITEDKVAKFIDEGVSQTAILFEAVKPKAGEMPVVLGAGASGILLHEAIGHGLEADFNRKGESIFATKLNQSIACPEVTIVDSGHIENNRGALNVDDEGTPAQRTVLVENGVLKSYMHDKISAKHYGIASTGNGRRENYQFAPVPRMRVTMMENGTHPREELFAGIKYGIYCEKYTNGQVFIGAGDYTFYVKNGYLIEDGKLTAPIKDVNIIGNGPDTLSKITMVANDFAIDNGTWTCGKAGQSAPVGLGMPSVLVSSITVGGV
ncbi:MAG: TldD/PmbA family protein [Proteobacteria bacterium]|nr:TldD/PmbA family protein [Pseudomonadota bacterium]